MAKPTLTTEQRACLIEWLTAGYSSAAIRSKAAEHNELAHRFANGEKMITPPATAPWPELSDDTLSYYRKRYTSAIETQRAERYTEAIESGLATKAERIARLKRIAEQLEPILWTVDKTGRMPNVKVYRETLADIAAEMGHRRQGVDLTLQGEIDQFLDLLQQSLDEQTYARILAIAAGRSSLTE